MHSKAIWNTFDIKNNVMSLPQLRADLECVRAWETQTLPLSRQDIVTEISKRLSPILANIIVALEEMEQKIKTK